MSTPIYPNGPRRRPSPGSSSMRNVQLPAFCRTRSHRSQLVSVNNLRNLQRLLLLLLFQLTTLLQEDQASARPARLPTWVSTRVICQVIGISRATLYRNLQQGVFRMGIECRRINPLAIKGQV